MTSRIVQVLCLLFCLWSFSSAQAQTPAPGLTLTNCTSNNYSSPTASTMSCGLSNSGTGAISSISYSTLAGMTVTGPTSCTASASCGVVRMTTGTTAGVYNGSLTITPNTGAAVVLPVNLAVYASDAVLNLTNCTQVNPTSTPTAATMSCALRKKSSTAINTLSYTSPTGTTITGPASCTGTFLGCGAVTITTTTMPGNYTGNATITPNTGAAVSLPINLTVTTTPAVLNFKACNDVTPTVAPQRASTTCTLGNTGGAVSSITYSSGLAVGSNITGPSSCAANSDCGTVTVTTRLTTGTYTGTMSATPNIGSAATRPVNLSVVAALTGLNLKSCVDVNPSEAPNQASTSCTLNNASATAVTSISYAGLPATMDVAGPTSCAASVDCGTVLVRSGNTVGSYSGTLTITPNTGAVVNKTINLQVNQAAVALSLKSCNNSNATTIVPMAASRSCVLRNDGSSPISTISYTPPAGQTVVGPTSCGANADCGTITATTETTAKTYYGTVTITPNSGNAITMPTNLRVNTDTILNLTACSDVTGTNSPTPAKTTCTLTNTGGTNASTITYSGLTGTSLTASGPATCAANTTCGDVIITSGDMARTYTGTLTVAATTGTSATKALQLVVNPALVMLTLETCESISPTTSPTRASRSCDLRNRGTSPATLTYSLPADSPLQLQAPAPADCPANGLCGKITVLTPTEAGSYTGDLIITPNIGTGTSMRVLGLRVLNSPANLSLVNCSSNSPTSFPTVGQVQCTLRNNGDISASNITYVKEAWMNVTGATSCAGKSDCGQVVISSPISAGSFTGNITLTPDNGTGASLPVNLQISGTPANLAISSCSVQSPGYSNLIPYIDCTLQNTGQTEISSITYSTLSTVRLKKYPLSCNANAYCAESVRIVLDYQGVYSGNLVITPNAGPSITLPYRLEMVAQGTPLLSINITPNPLSLVADNTGKASGIATVNVSGGSQPYTYSWVRKTGTRSTALNATTNSPTISATLAARENFQEIWTVSVRDAANVISTQDLAVNFTDNTPIPLTASIAPSSPITLAVNAPAVASSTLTVTPNGGTAPYSYNWTRTSGSISTLTSNQIANPVVSASINTGDNFQEIWKVTVTDATNTSTTASVTLVFKANVVTPIPTLTITRNPNDNPWIVGKSYTTTIVSTNATTVAYNCVVDDNNAGGYNGSGTTVVNGTADPVTAISSWVGHPSTCTWTATGPGGTKVVTEKLTTVSPPAGPPAIVSFNASNTNIRVATGQSGNVTFTGEASQSSGQITKLELFSNNGSGYGATPVKSASGTTTSLSINTTVTVSAGSYRFKLRATNQDGTTSESAEIIVNITDSALLGEISGIRTNQTDSNKLELFGWACQYGNATALNYTVYADAPANLNGTFISTGIANVATETTNAAVKEICNTPNASHHFVLNLDAYAQTYQGRRLFVEVATSNNSAKAVLPCADYSCTMPGALRIGLTTPKNNDRYTGPATVFMLAKISNSIAPFDEVAFYINGEWVNAAPDTTATVPQNEVASMYSVQKTGVPSNTLPYPVYAKVRKGNTTIYSAENLIYVDAINDGVTVNMMAPLDNQEATIATPITLDTEVIPTQGSTAQIATVKFFVNGAVLASATGPVSNRWTYNWTPSQLGVMSVKAQAFNADGKMFGESSAVKVNVIDMQGPSSAEPIPVVIDVPYLNNPDAGTLPGSLNVNASGAAAYSIPLDVPPGTAGMQPQLSLSYSSQSQNSRVGLGWNLGGFSSIHRCGMTIAQDGINGRISFDQEDRLCLDGQRLILVNRDMSNANYWSSGAEFRTELESFTKITAIGEIGARTFEVRTKDGHISTYGGDTATVKAILGTPKSGVDAVALLPKEGAQSWALNTVKDRSNNYIQYLYDQDTVTGEHRPIRIEYGGNAQPAHAAVELTYEPRNDAWMRYIDETRNDLRLRLKAVTTYVDGNVNAASASRVYVRETKLSYEHSPTSGRSLLQSVEACARNPQSGSIECLPKTTFNWGKPDAGKTPGFVSRGEWLGAPILTTWNKLSNEFQLSANHADYFAFSDFSGDGLTDVLEKRVASPMPVGEQSATQVDFNKSNPIAPGTLRTQYRYFHNNGHGFTTYQYQLSTAEEFAVLDIGDFDGNGSPDVLAYTKTGTKICLSPLANSTTLSTSSNIVFQCRSDLAAQGSNSVYRRPYILDIQGDGRSAHYSTIGRDGKATLCEGSSCIIDDAPPSILGLSYPTDGRSESPTRDYASIVQMVDFSGTGKSSDVRWSEVHFAKYFYDADGTKYTINEYQNLTPIISIVGFSKPGTNRDVGQIRDYKYPTYPNPCPGTYCGYPYFFDSPVQGANLSADFNGSGYTSLGFGFVEKGRDANGIFTYQRAENTFCLSTGRALDCAIRQKISGSQYKAIRAIGNFVGDGQASILVEDIKFQSGMPPTSDNTLQMCRLLGDDTTKGLSADDSNLVCTPWSAPNVPNPDPVVNSSRWYFMDLLGTGRTQLVHYLSGKYVNNEWQENGKWEVFEPTDIAKPNEALDRIVSVTNGLGATSTVEYVDGIPSGIVSQSASPNLTYPLRKTPQTGKIVSRLRHSNGVASERSSRYQYQDAAIDISGRGSLGFAKFTVTDEQTGMVNVTTYKQGWPHTSMVDTAMVSINNKLISKTTNTWNTKTIAQLYGTTKMTFADSKVETWDINTGESMGVTTTTHTYGDNWGNLTNQVIQLSGTEGTYSTTNNNVYDNTKSATWLIGQLTHTGVTKTKPDGTAITRNGDITYDAVTGLPETQTIEQADELLRVKTTLVRNTFGLVKTKIEDWKKPNTDVKDTTPSSRTTSMTYDDNGRFIATVTNALKQTETHEYEPGTGARKSLTDPNALTTKWQSNGFGRITKELRADGNETRSYVKSCRGVDTCPMGDIVQITEHFNGIARTKVPQLTFVDHASHVLRQQSYGFDGKAFFADQSYDNLGRADTAYHPYFDQETRYPESRQEYDALNRVIAAVTFSETGTALRATTDYQGFTTTLINLLGQKRVELRNLAKQLIKVTDHLLGETQFSYEPNGNLSQTIDPNGNIITVKYDKLGRKTQLNDPDLGQIDYVVDPIGQTWKQISPKQRALSQATTFVFDAAGRMTDRYETDLESHWVFDTANKGIGQLAEAYTGPSDKKTYRRLNQYDDLARPISSTQSLTDGTYIAKIDYDAWGRVIQQRYQRNTGINGAEKNFGSRYNNKGYLHWIERGGLKLKTILKQDAAQRVLETLSGNGLKEIHGYNPYTARMGTVDINTAANAVHISETYHYDSIGNVTSRDQTWDKERFKEDFLYDELNRLKSSDIAVSTSAQASTKQVFTYDKVGNILTKTNVANNQVYSYPPQGKDAIRPHAVQSIGTTYTDFSYDANGNLSSGAGRTISWTSFDMPNRIEKAGITSEFRYGPEHQRTVQVKNKAQIDEMSIIYAGAQEVETKGSTVTIKTYWPMGIGVEIDRGSAGTEYNWTHADRLGSPIAHSDQNGSFREKMAYDAWGKRRNLADSTTPSNPGIIGKTDNRGYTGHEMLDALELVHMNGRVYDPLLGKFLSGDILIQDPMNGQNYNRYSYVLNNPTNLIDPTGFADCVASSSDKEACKTNGKDVTPEGEKVQIVEVTPKKSEETGPVKSSGANLAVLGSGGEVRTSAKNNQNSNAGSGSSAPSAYQTFSNWAHGGLSVAGAVPAAGIVPDIADWVLTLAEIPFGKSDWTDLGLASLGIAATFAPVIADGPAAFAKMARRTSKACGCCFTAETPVLTEHGLVPIRDIQLGTLVMSRNEATGETTLKPVTALIFSEGRQLYAIALLEQNGKITRIEASDNHPFWVKGRGWIDSAQLKRGMKVSNFEKKTSTVVNVEDLGRTDSTYNLTVADFHTFFAGDGRAFVHNCANACAKAFSFLNKAGKFYPDIPDLRTGRSITFPTGSLQRVPKAERVAWGAQERGAFIKEWYDRGYKTPHGGWDQYDIHHIQPREFGGSNDFWNLSPVQRQTHQQELNSFWRDM